MEKENNEKQVASDLNFYNIKKNLQNLRVPKRNNSLIYCQYMVDRASGPVIPRKHLDENKVGKIGLFLE